MEEPPDVSFGQDNHQQQLVREDYHEKKSPVFVGNDATMPVPVIIGTFPRTVFAKTEIVFFDPGAEFASVGFFCPGGKHPCSRDNFRFSVSAADRQRRSNVATNI